MPLGRACVPFKALPMTPAAHSPHSGASSCRLLSPETTGTCHVQNQLPAHSCWSERSPSRPPSHRDVAGPSGGTERRGEQRAVSREQNAPEAGCGLCPRPGARGQRPALPAGFAQTTSLLAFYFQVSGGASASSRDSWDGQCPGGWPAGRLAGVLGVAEASGSSNWRQKTFHSGDAAF